MRDRFGQMLVPAILVLALVVAVRHVYAQAKPPVPAAELQESARKAATEIYGGRFRQAKTAAEKMALATEMIEAATKVQDGSPDQYVLLKIAADISAGAGDAPAALQAVEKMAERFDVPGPKLTAETLMAAAGNASTTSQHKAVSEAVLKIADAVAGAEEYKLALDLCESARASAQKARQYPLAKELAAKIDDFQKRQRAFQEYKAAWALMQEDPAEPAANLTAGRYLCFVKGDWLKGVPMLALGSDAALRNVSLMELRGAKSAEQQAAIGDAWWDAAEARQGEERNLLQLRAGLWYRQSATKLGGLAALKIKQRLEELSKPARAEEAQGQGDGGVQVVCEWQRFADSKPLPNLKLLSNGRIDNPSGPAVWCQRGRVLLTLWLAQKPPGSVFDMAVFSPEGTTYSATNSWGGRSSGRLLRGTNLVEKPYLANVPSDGRMAALVKDLDTLLGKWHRRNTNSAYEAIWTFYDDGTVTSTSGAPKGTWWIGPDAVRVTWSEGQWDTLRRPLGGVSVTGDSWAGTGVVSARKIP